LSKRVLAVLALALAACQSSSDNNTLPSFVVASSVATTSYDGTSDDLLTAGLGKSGLQNNTAPSVSATPTAAELRRLAIYNNYRALVDITTGGGYGVLYGPNVDVNGGNTLGEGRIAGDEWIAYDDDGTGAQNVTMLVQVPSSFDANNPCIVTGTSSGSRGVYGAIATAGEWGLKHGCAVAYTDKGSGNGIHDLQNNTVNLIDGRRQDAGTAAKASNFTAPNLNDTDRATYNAAYPNRFAVKHAHSQQNPEKDWGKYTLHAIEFAYYVLNQKFGTPQSDAGNAAIARKYHPGQILTIAASVSNGGGASVAAAEQDTQHWVSGVVAGEPQVQVASTSNIQRGGTNVAASAKSLYDYTTIAALYQACAALSTQVSDTSTVIALFAGDTTGAQNRCATLKAKGLLTATTLSAQEDEALAKLNQAGWEADSNLLHGSHFFSYASPAVAVTYANAYARANVKDNLCDYSFGVTNAGGSPAAPSAAQVTQLAQIFGTGNGIPPTGPITLIDNASIGGPKRDQLAQSPDAVASPGNTATNDYNTDGVACLRSLFTGQDASGAALTGTLLAQSNAVKTGIQQALRTGRLRGIPTILVQGRSDALVPVNHASRAYLGANKMADGASSPTFYYEVQNAQHFDAFLPLPPLAGRFLPLHRYVIQGLDLMYAHLKSNAALPPSQVVRTTPRGFGGPGGAMPNNISPTNVPPISPSPAAADQITFANGTLNIPN
jgi:hydroxybutyrate-dimer hydrolase